MTITKRFCALLSSLALLLALAGCGTAGEMPSSGDAPQAPIFSADAAQNTPEAEEDGPELSLPSSQPTVPEAPSSGAGNAATEAGKDTQTPPPPAAEADDALSCTMSISCATLLEHMDALAAEKVALVPVDGLLLPAAEYSFEAGESVFDLLKRTCREEKIHMEFSETPLYGSAYIEGIGNLYEFDGGEGSGWMYRVNGAFPNVGCSQYTLQDGDVVEWVYTCDYGADVGGEVPA